MIAINSSLVLILNELHVNRQSNVNVHGINIFYTNQIIFAWNFTSETSYNFPTLHSHIIQS